MGSLMTDQWDEHLRNAATLVWPAYLSSKTPRHQRLSLSRLASRLWKLSTAPTCIAGPATPQPHRKAASVGGLFHFHKCWASRPATLLLPTK
jgi:hypothetical protein